MTTSLTGMDGTESWSIAGKNVNCYEKGNLRIAIILKYIQLPTSNFSLENRSYKKKSIKSNM